MMKSQVFLSNSSVVNLSSTGRVDASACNKSLLLPMNLNKRKRKHQLSHDQDIITAETKKTRIGFFGVKKDEDHERSKTRKTGETTKTKQIDDRHKSFAAARTNIQTTMKQSALPMKVSKTSRPPPLNMMNSSSQPPTKVSENPKSFPASKKNDTGTLELFEIAKKTADIANVKGILTSETETALCLDTLALLLEYPISAEAPETRQIMMRLEHLTKHKNRKICNSASSLLHCWRQQISRQLS